MKKITLVSIVSILFLSIASIVAYLLKFINNNSKVLFLILGIVILIISGIFAASLKKYKFNNILCLGISSISLGFLIRAWYIFRDFDNALWVMLLVSFACAIYLWVYYLLLFIPFFDKHCGIFTIIFIILSLIGYIIVMSITETTYISTFGYYMIVEISFIIALCMKSNTISNVLRNIVLCSFSIFIVALIMIILMLAGDGMDFDFDFSIDGGSSKIDSPKDKRITNDLENRL